MLNDHLYKTREISPDFLSVSVNGIDSSSLLVGRPYGGCSILYRKSLSSCITPLNSCSDRFCAIKIIDSSGSSVLLVSVYMPHRLSSFDDYLIILGELEGFMDSQQCDRNILVGDFNVDLDCGGCLADLLNDYISDSDLCVCDLSYSSSVKYTFESNDGVSHSWIDHIINYVQDHVPHLYQMYLHTSWC